MNCENDIHTFLQLLSDPACLPYLESFNKKLSEPFEFIVKNIDKTVEKRVVWQGTVGLACGLLLQHPQQRIDQLFQFQFDFRTEYVYFDNKILETIPDERLQRLRAHRLKMTFLRLSPNK